MLTINDIINASFNKSNFGGYKTEDVDVFMDEVKESYELLIKKNIEQKEANESLAEENRKLAKKIDLLAKKVEEYREEENEIKNALISAQKLSEAAIREARHKAEIILKDAQMKADEKVASIADEVEEKKEELEKMRQIVSDFRKTLLDKYKEHLTLINNIPNRKKQVKLEEPKQPEPSEENKPKELHTQSLEEHMIEKTQPIDIKGAIGKEPSEEETDSVSVQQSSQEAASRVTSSIEVEEVDEAPTKKFHLNATSFEKAPEERRGRDLRYDVLKFGEDYNIAEDDDDEEPSSSRMKRNK